MDFEKFPLQRDIKNHLIICFKPTTAQKNGGNISDSGSESILLGGLTLLSDFPDPDP